MCFGGACFWCNVNMVLEFFGFFLHIPTHPWRGSSQLQDFFWQLVFQLENLTLENHPFGSLEKPLIKDHHFHKLPPPPKKKKTATRIPPSVKHTNLPLVRHGHNPQPLWFPTISLQRGGVMEREGRGRSHS